METRLKVLSSCCFRLSFRVVFVLSPSKVLVITLLLKTLLSNLTKTFYISPLSHNPFCEIGGLDHVKVLVLKMSKL